MLTSNERKIAILQPNYIPWKGTFDLINQVDVFVFYDDVQYTVKDWRSRNRIKTQSGDIWLSVPVIHKGRRNQLIYEAEIDTSSNWQKAHFKSLSIAYKKAPYYDKYSYLFDEIYRNNEWTNIADLNIFTTKLISNALGIKTDFYRSKDLSLNGSKNGDKVIKICKILECNHFINGPSAKAFMDHSLFEDCKIKLSYIEYDYLEYTQLYGEFNHFVTVLDVLFNCGPNAGDYIFSGKTQNAARSKI